VIIESTRRTCCAYDRRLFVLRGGRKQLRSALAAPQLLVIVVMKGSAPVTAARTPFGLDLVSPGAPTPVVPVHFYLHSTNTTRIDGLLGLAEKLWRVGLIGWWWSLRRD
jgi:hypothetical protein